MSFAQILTAQPLQSANDRSRWETVWSLVERGTFQIDEIDARPGWSTIDKVRHNGHFYSSKPPWQSLLVAGVYWVVKQVTGWSLDIATSTGGGTVSGLRFVPVTPCRLEPRDLDPQRGVVDGLGVVDSLTRAGGQQR